MFNFSGSEIVFLLLLALIILGPEKLPDAVRRFGKAYAEFKKVANGFQSELKSALDEPVREMRATADELRKAATFDLKPGLQPDPGPAAERATPAQPLTSAPDAATAAAPTGTPVPPPPTEALTGGDAPPLLAPGFQSAQQFRAADGPQPPPAAPLTSTAPAAPPSANGHAGPRPAAAWAPPSVTADQAVTAEPA